MQTTEEQRNAGLIVWRGLAMPVLRSKGGYFTSKGVVDLVWSSLMMVLATPRNFRVMMPNFGVGLYEELFENDPGVIATRLKVLVETEVPKWDARVNVIHTDVAAGDDTITVTAVFSVIGQPETYQRSLTVNKGPIGGI